jgi:tRNA nucleotidyltransferase (CCA-adding enzyme)
MTNLDTSVLRRVLPQDVRRLCRRLSACGFRAWVVGGCVRDILLRQLGPAGTETGANRNDWDIATDARPDQVRSCFRRVLPTGIQHGTVTVLWHGTGYEVTTLRGETTYSDGRHPDSVYFVNDIQSDLARRDFTVNAMAYEPLRDELIDPFGGIADLRARILRAVGAASERFAEDGLRVLRAARLAATHQLELDPSTASAIVPSLASYRKVSPERIREEWVKAMYAERPSRAFELMQTHGLLGITAPELQQTVGIPQVGGQDLWRHALRCLDACPPRPLLRLAALLHDAGKAQSVSDGRHADAPFFEHELVGAKLADTLLRRLRFSNQDRNRVVALVRHHRIRYDTAWDAAAVRRWVFRVRPDLVDDLLALGRADLLSSDSHTARRAAELGELEQRVTKALGEKMVLSARDLAIDGHDLIQQFDLVPGALVGQLLRQLLEEAVADPALNRRELLLARARQLLPR